jgi:hypothetical protein
MIYNALERSNPGELNGTHELQPDPPAGTKNGGVLLFVPFFVYTGTC